MKHKLVILLAIALISAPMVAQTAQTDQEAPATAQRGLDHKMKCPARPPARGYAMSAYDWHTGNVFLIGGIDEPTDDLSYPLHDVWSYNTFTRRWTLRLDTDEFFNAFQRDAIALDPRSKQIVLYSTFVDLGGGEWWGVETWIYDIRKNTFENVTSGTEPPLRWGSRMVYDIESRKAILFGGSSGLTFETLNDTWAFDFETKEWTQIHPAVNPPPPHYPPPHYFAAMAYDPLADLVVLFGGAYIDNNYEDVSLNDTWTYDYNTKTWTKLDPAESPPVRLYHAMAWDLLSNRMIMFGGVEKPYEPLLGDTWALDLKRNSWTQLTPRREPSERAWHVMQGTWGGALLFGGSPRHDVFTYGDTWIYRSHPNRWIRADRGWWRCSTD